MARPFTTRSPEHGTIYGYNHQHCRCPLCKDAWRSYSKKVRKRRWARGKCVACSRPTVPGHFSCALHLKYHRERSIALNHGLPLPPPVTGVRATPNSEHLTTLRELIRSAKVRAFTEAERDLVMKLAVLTLTPPVE